jgi:eukaryotic-like serine/threonine-protein kinase
MCPSSRTRSCDTFNLSAEPSAIRGLTPEQKDRLTEILDRYFSGLEQGVPPAREDLLTEFPALAEPLNAYLDRLDELHDAAVGFASSGGAAEEIAAPTNEEKRLGDFRILHEIGRGGMGVVYEAQQISLGRRVALKVLPFAAVLDARQTARFKHEAQAAAQLDHPNIVSVFAVGIDRGVHYYAMQLIDGQPLDRALAELRGASSAGVAAKHEESTITFSNAAVGPPSCQFDPSTGVPPACHGQDGRATREFDVLLSNAANLSTVDYCPATPGSLLSVRSVNEHEYCRSVMHLGIQAAEALHAAHEHGVVHRDVKPSNLLLDGSGKLWVTDFGLARCRSDAPVTRTGDLVGTLRYMSPEQALGRSALVDHRTDIYSLGVTLYELLALQPAFFGDDGPVLLRQIEQQEPRPLRQLQPKVPADLETVVLKAMAKQREERYATAQELADDLRRVLEGKPTLAKPPTIAERLRKWTRRHRRTVAAAVAVCMLAMLGMAASTLLIAREKARTQHNFELAKQHFREAQDAVEDLGKQVAEQLADVPGAARVRRELLGETLRYYVSFADQAKQNPDLRADLALTYNKIGMLNAEIGSNDEAIKAHEKAIELFEELAAGNPHKPDYRRRLAISQNDLGLALRRSGRIDAARRAYRDAIRLQEKLVEELGEVPQYLTDLALSNNNLGLLQSETGRKANAEELFRKAIRLQERLLEIQPRDPESLRDLAASLNNLSALRVATQPDQAAELYQKALAYETKAAAMRPDKLKYKRDAALTHNNLGAVRSRQSQFAEAAASYARAVDIQRELVRAAPVHNSYRHDLAVSYNNLGLAQSRLGRTADAERSFRQALDLQEVLVRQNPYDLDLQSNLGGIYNNLGTLLEELQRNAEAADDYRHAVEHQQIAWKGAPQVSRYRMFLSNHYYNYARILRRLGRPDEAARLALARRDLWPGDPQHLYAVAEELALATGLLARSNRGGASAQQCAESAVETLRQAKAAGWVPPSNDDWSKSFAALKDRPGFAELVKR